MAMISHVVFKAIKNIFQPGDYLAACKKEEKHKNELLLTDGKRVDVVTNHKNWEHVHALKRSLSA